LVAFSAGVLDAGYTGEVVFFVSGLSSGTTKRLRDYGVQLIPFDYFSVRIRRHFDCPVDQERGSG